MLLRKKEEIEAWLNEYYIENYELIEDEKYGYIVNVNDNVGLFNKDLKSIHVKFHNVTGRFDCSFNQLISLEGCPEMVKKSFECNNNQLKSLEGGPKIVNGFFNCSFNQLTSLKHTPEIVSGYFDGSDNQLISLDNNLISVNEYIDISNNKLTINEIIKLLKIKNLKEINLLANKE